MAPTPLTQPIRSVGERRRRLWRLERQRRLVNVAALLAGLGLGWSVGVALASEPLSSVRTPGGPELLAGRVTGMAGTYLLLVMVLLMARIPMIERAVGQDTLSRWHRRIGGWPVGLLVAHAGLITIGYAEAARSGVWAEIGGLVRHGPDILAAIVALALLLLVGTSCIRRLRNRLRYETWWAIHLYVYLGLALSFAHQLATGVPFLGHRSTEIAWSALWVATAGSVIVARVLLPLWRTVHHGIRVAEVNGEAPGVISLRCSGRHLEALGATGGQFFQWRFLRRGLWWQAHPYSLSASPRPDELRVTIKVIGDHSAAAATLRPGTRVAIEGPYGTFTAQHRRTERALLVGAGVGITPIRAVLEDLPPWVHVIAILRASTPDQLVLRDEIHALVAPRRGHVVELVGPRQELALSTSRAHQRHQIDLDAHLLRQLIPDITERDIYVCGPDEFASAIDRAARRCRVPAAQIHREAFEF